MSKQGEPQGKGAGLPDGVFAASLTPLQENYTTDFALLKQHVLWLLSNGCDGVALFGTTGEANSLSNTERMAGLDAIMETGIAPTRLLVGTGSCAAAETVALTRHAVRNGVGGVLVLPPFYYKNPSDEGLFAFYDHVIQGVGDSGLAVYLYHIPPVSQVPFSHSLVERLLKRYPNTVVGMKDSGGDFEHMQSIRAAFPELQLFAGTERFLLDILRTGGKGCISATVNVSSLQAARVYSAWRNNDADSDSLQAELTRMRRTLEPFPMIPALKALAGQRTGVSNWRSPCPPLMPLDPMQCEQLFQATEGVLPR